MDYHTKSYKLPDPGVPIQSRYIHVCINRAVQPFTQTVSLGCLWIWLKPFIRQHMAYELGLWLLQIYLLAVELKVDYMGSFQEFV